MTDGNRSTRVDVAYDRLKGEIRSSRMPPGFQAPEPEIALRLGMSRTPVREALVRLEADGLVEMIPRRGARVLPVNAADMKEIYDILTSLEPDAAAALAARNPTEEDLAPLVTATEEMETALETADLDAWAAADDRFHRRLLDLHGNRRLVDIVSVLFDQAHRARMVTLRMRAVPKRSTREHREILEHLRGGRSEAVRRTFLRHRRRAAGELLAVLHDFRLMHL